MIYVLVPIYIIVCVFLILVVLLQQGKGADVASAFGASSSQTTFGARGATTVLEKVTTWSFVAFSVLAVAISLLQARPKSSVLQQLGTQPPAKSAPGRTGRSGPGEQRPRGPRGCGPGARHQRSRPGSRGPRAEVVFIRSVSRLASSPRIGIISLPRLRALVAELVDAHV
ncbi:MAG: preprotein translocase subunit SecG [Holophagales bacterium]|nr:preprotein translocase subunit SecG [Holophagales bacterium]